jgi:hypothetical protein
MLPKRDDVVAPDGEDAEVERRIAESGVLPVPLGRVVITAGAAKVLGQRDVAIGLARHRIGDWGDVSADDKLLNDQARQEGDRLLSSYKTSKGTVFWIITEADRSCTTILLPEEY